MVVDAGGVALEDVEQVFLGEHAEDLFDVLLGVAGDAVGAGRDAGGVGEVGLEEEVFRAPHFDGLDGAGFFEPEAAEALAAEVLAGQEVHFGVLFAAAGVEPLPVHRFEQVGDPADAGLDGDEVEFGEAVAHAGEDHVEDGVGVVEEELDGALGVGGLAAVVDGDVAQLGEVAGADVEVDREAEVLGLVPERVPVLLGQAGHAEDVGLVGHQHALVAAAVGALHFVDAGLDVPEGHGHDRDEAVGFDAGPFDQEVVVGADAFEAQGLVGQGEEVAAAEAADVGVDDLGVHAVFVHPLEPLADFPGAVVGLLQGRRVVGRRGFPAGHRGAGGGHELLAAHDPAVLVDFVVEDDVGDEVAPLFGGDAIRPQVFGLGHVGVGVDHLDSVADHLGHGKPRFAARRLSAGCCPSMGQR